MEEERFHISHIILALLLIVAWIFITRFYADILETTKFLWLNLMYMPIYIFATMMFYCNSVHLIFLELKLLGKIKR